METEGINFPDSVMLDSLKVEVHEIKGTNKDCVLKEVIYKGLPE